eukprot:m.47793 g.47793  ORF g.47793 m.47793 type:complete len:363 (-) comp6000_c0_seq1:3-1091(-)
MVQLGEDLLALFLGKQRIVGCEVEPALEAVEIIKDVRQKEVKQGPQLCEVVLQRGASDQEAIGALEGLEVLDEAAVQVLDAVALVDDEILPRQIREEAAVFHDDLEGGYDNWEADLLLSHDVRSFGRALRGGAVVEDDGDRGGKALELGDPVAEGGERGDDEIRAADLHLIHVRKERDDLDRLAQAHFVSEDAVQSVLVQRLEPLHADKLVIAQRAARNELGLLKVLLGLLRRLALGRRAGKVCSARVIGKEDIWFDLLLGFLLLLAALLCLLARARILHRSFLLLLLHSREEEVGVERGPVQQVLEPPKSVLVHLCGLCERLAANLVFLGAGLLVQALLHCEHRVGHVQRHFPRGGLPQLA